MKYAVIRFSLPDGTVVGYNGDVLCHIHSTSGSAKHYALHSTKENEEQLALVRSNFESSWKVSERAKAALGPDFESQAERECWKGYPLEQIKIEMVPVMPITETIRYLFRLNNEKKKNPETFAYRMNYLKRLLEDPDGEDLAEAKKVVAEEERVRLGQKELLIEKFQRALDAIL